ncbi:MAG TPA: phage tail assembly protein [Gammaproteobacteria bacterium]
MAEINVLLINGYKLGDAVIKDVVIRDITAGDIIESQIEAERLVQTEDGPELVTSPTLAGVHMLRRQIVSIGDIQGPISLHEIKRLDPVDFNLLQAKASELESACMKKASGEAAVQRGRDHQGESID